MAKRTNTVTIDRERRKRARQNDRITHLGDYKEFRDPYTGEPVLRNGYGDTIYPRMRLWKETDPDAR